MSETVHNITSISDTDDTVIDVEKLTITKGGLFRGGIKFLATSSVRFVISSAVATLVPVENAKDKRKAFIGTYVISGMINEKVKDYIDGEIDDKLEYYYLVRDKVREINAESDTNISTL